MGRLLTLAALAVVAIATAGCAAGTRTVITHTAEPLRFIHPKARVANAGLQGVDIPVQVWVEPDEQNRALVIAWDGPGCYGSSFHQLDGLHEAIVQPPMAPINVRMKPGICTIVAGVFGPGNKLLRRISFEMHVCGGEVSCGGDDAR